MMYPPQFSRCPGDQQDTARLGMGACAARVMDFGDHSRQNPENVLHSLHLFEQDTDSKAVIVKRARSRSQYSDLPSTTDAKPKKPRPASGRNRQEIQLYCQTHGDFTGPH
jgi:hypothetical protein